MDATDEGFELRETRDEGEVVLALCGDLDIAVTENLRTRFQELRRETAPVRLDLSRLDFIDSSGLACITEAVREAREDGRDFEVGRDLREQVRRLLELVDGEQLFWPTR
ncbi:MAG TPA: STAS domain-containing protein [Solirubrobacteraceae bacterium]|nr:STAS domain-containing protein [Solirubrobacteraceae bacterium]